MARAFPLVLALSFAAPAHADPANRVAAAETDAYRILDNRGTVRILLEPQNGGPVALGEMVLQPGAQVPEHAHEGSAEILYVIEGTLDARIAGKDHRFVAGDVLHAPAGVKHSVVVTGARPARLVQVYSPPGPEQRFKKGEKVSR